MSRKSDNYTILVLCTGNSCRSQMAQGFLNHYGKDNILAFSAGIQTHGVNPRAIQVMEEVGVNISHHTSNNIDEYLDRHFDIVFTVCDHAKENCPYFPNADKRIHYDFFDPAKAKGNDEDIINSFREVRDEIKICCLRLIQSLKSDNEEE